MSLSHHQTHRKGVPTQSVSSDTDQPVDADRNRTIPLPWLAFTVSDVRAAEELVQACQAPQMNDVVYDFGFGDTLAYEVLPYREIGSAKATAGIYGWYLRAPDGAAPNLAKLAAVYSSKSLDTTAFGNLSERYTGVLTKAAVPDAIIAHTSIASAALSIFAPPLYIGISSNIRMRLSQHEQALRNALGSPIKNTIPADLELDTEAESSYFGERIGSAMKQAGYTHAGDLWVKIVYCPSSSRMDIREAETFVNRSFHPIFGRL